MEAGARGVTFGRNIFQHPNPPAMVSSIYKIIIGGKGPKEAILNLDRNKG
jgi:fructose-bisphosphate aldolase/2-amino-3,7-dideoxy-D-threo-hept-6-ulosonate synthase